MCHCRVPRAASRPSPAARLSTWSRHTGRASTSSSAYRWTRVRPPMMRTRARAPPRLSPARARITWMKSWPSTKRRFISCRVSLFFFSLPPYTLHFLFFFSLRSLLTSLQADVSSACLSSLSRIVQTICFVFIIFLTCFKINSRVSWFVSHNPRWEYFYQTNNNPLLIGLYL